MILLVDIGNSRIKWACLDNGVLSGSAVCSHERNILPEEFKDEWKRLATPQRIVVVSVASNKFLSELKGFIVSLWGCGLELIIPQVKGCGLINGYSEPERLGGDRWAAMIAAYHEYGGPVCIVDCGTALTIDVVAEDGRHLGGLIIPGLSMMRQALIEKTEKVDLGTEAFDPAEISLLAQDTQNAVIGGTLYTLVAAIDRVVVDVSEALPRPMTSVITGGDAAAILPLLSGRYQHKPELVLLGLAIIAGQTE